MDVLACIKRVPDTGAKIVLTEDQRGIDASNLGFTMSPHEECAIEEAVQLVDENGGTATVMTLGPEAAEEQLRDGLAMTADEAVLLPTEGEEWGPRATAGAIVEAVLQEGNGDVGFDLLLFGNESADMANYQVPIRVAHALDLPCVSGVKDLSIDGETATARRDVTGGAEVYEIDLPAVIAVKEGLNEPRYASMRAKMRARNQEVRHHEPTHESSSGTFEMIRLETPPEEDSEARILGEGPDAAEAVLTVLRDEVEVL